ncbi:alpha/beta hydrolase [Bacillus sp. CLL-7-23]|uniref:Alpha/beta hydrolase n=1 Tax=Bacillus changyiensis TaxID=3004103 RepID=A0ABT4X0T0_9BACI|nr:alpha/beta hydrolase [Bacillus changyiensis]MDA7025765.1 alpha/beta hydrolase [Bacillus changyiensis]
MMITDRKVDVFQFNGLTIEYSLLGDGEPILVMHGGHSNCYEEFGYQALYEKGLLLITPSRAGYGRTSKEIGDTLESACDYYLALLDHLEIDKVHVLAMSAGGPSALYFTSVYPDRVKSLILQSAVTKKWLTKKDIEYKIGKSLFHPFAEKVVWKLISSLNNRYPKWMFKKMIPSFSSLPPEQVMFKLTNEDIEELRKMNNRQRSGYGFLIDLKSIDELSVYHLQSISCPVLIMHCPHDRVVPLDHADHANQYLPNSKIYQVDAWGHLIWLGTGANSVADKVISFVHSLK